MLPKLLMQFVVDHDVQMRETIADGIDIRPRARSLTLRLLHDCDYTRALYRALASSGFPFPVITLHRAVQGTRGEDSNRYERCNTQRTSDDDLA